MNAFHRAAMTMCLFVSSFVAHVNHKDKSPSGDIPFGPVPNERNHEDEDS